ncbi:M23 family metallopeptidase [Nonlabens agnitus]|uniref:Peptidase M23 n=1 Tax=Nonlabens agnitus TaxID=870484 RepID=A0A2S9WUS7_9FLAO|nr:M23 family metallopeptidase [Nonlabens agnitus]PRP67096.1 peptidase M23 [Nonlabens agnitus]
MQTKYICFLLLGLFIVRFGESQTTKELPQDYFHHPLDIKLILSGTFGELRSNHFHSGLDIKTNQRTGANVHAAAAGYVSRIKIEHYGYGKALYVTHPNGYTTVYAHLEKFSPRIEEYVKARQYAQESYEIQLYPDDLELRVDQDEIIAYSGNSGGSGGPHLHFEIRDGAARPMNPMLFGIDIPDSRNPLVKQVKAYPLDAESTVNGKNEAQLLRVVPLQDGKFKVEPFSAYGNIGMGVNTNDRLDGANNQNGVYTIKTYFNGSPHFKMTFDKFSFDETRYINQMIDFEHFKKSKSRISRLYIPDGSPLSLYGDVNNQGKLQLFDPGSTHVYKVNITDFKGNDSEIVMDITNESKLENLQVDSPKDATLIPHNETYTTTLGAFTLTIPQGSLYEDTFLNIKQNSDTLKVHEDIVPLHKNMVINYDMSSKQDEDRDKYFIARTTSWGAAYYTPSRLKGNTLTAFTKTLGTYAISKDTKDPTIAPVNFKDGQWISKNQTLKLKINDKDTGVQAYRATVNGKFILMEYDYKTDLLTHYFEDGVVTDTDNELVVIVTDNVGNSSKFEATFHRKE